MGHKVGDRVLVKASDTVSYYVQIRSIEKGTDDESLPIRQFWGFLKEKRHSSKKPLSGLTF